MDMKRIMGTTSRAAKEADALSIRLQELTEEIRRDLVMMDQEMPKEEVLGEGMEDRYPYGGPYCSADVLGLTVACLLRGANYWRWDGEVIQWDQELPGWIGVLGIKLINDWRKDQNVLEVCWRHPISKEVRNYVMFPGEYLLFDFEPRILYPEKLETYFNYIEEQKNELAKYLDDHINGIRVLAETIEEIREAKRNHK